MQGFFIFDHLARTREFLDEVTPWVREGKIRYREDIVDSLNFGKLIVRVAS